MLLMVQASLEKVEACDSSSSSTLIDSAVSVMDSLLDLTYRTVTSSSTHSLAAASHSLFDQLFEWMRAVDVCGSPSIASNPLSRSITQFVDKLIRTFSDIRQIPDLMEGFLASVGTCLTDHIVFFFTPSLLLGSNWWIRLRG